MKRHFLTGLILILPAVLTLLIVKFLVNFLTQPFLGITEYLLKSQLGIVQSPVLLTFLSQVWILVFLFFMLVLIGFMGRLFLVNALFKLGDKVIYKIPFANKIYTGLQEILHNIFMANKPNFSQVVLVPFPYARAKAIGFITSDATAVQNSSQELVSVFLLGTPNPMMGFRLLVPKEQIIPLKMPLEDAMKFVASCGVIYPRSSEGYTALESSSR